MMGLLREQQTSPMGVFDKKMIKHNIVICMRSMYRILMKTLIVGNLN